MKPRSVMIIGAGPHGLAAAVFLRAAGMDVSIHGKPMESWKEKMPQRMILRSTKISSSIASPGNALSIEQYERRIGSKLNNQPTIGQFIAYTQWVQENAVPDVHPEKITHLERTSNGFSATLDDGRIEQANAVVMATGILPYPFIPEEFRSLPPQFCTHVSKHTSFDSFKGKNVIVIGKGQSALEAAALIQESGGQVELLTRGSGLQFIKRPGRGLVAQIRQLPAIHEFLYPPTDLAGPPHNWVIADPVLYRKVPRIVKEKMFELVGPIGSTDLEKRIAGVTVTTRAAVDNARLNGNDGVYLELSDGSRRMVDHVILGTGYKPEINRCEFLSPDLKKSIAQENGYPILTLGYESVSVKGFYVLGALSCWSQGPINRFVCGTYPVGQYLTEAVAGSRIGYPDRSTSWQVTARRWLYQMYSLSASRVPGH